MLFFWMFPFDFLFDFLGVCKLYFLFSKCMMMGSVPASFGSNYRCKRPKRLSKKGSGLWKRPMAEEQEGTCFGKGNRKGGARHFSKPYVDTGLVYTVLEDNKEILQDLGNYECTSKNNAPDAKGLVQTLPLWKGLLRLEKSGEIHAQPLRTALIKFQISTKVDTQGRSGLTFEWKGLPQSCSM